MSGRCCETQGLLFKRRCTSAATSHCSACNKPICSEHGRSANEQQLCIGCTRERIRGDASQSASLSHLRDDPYFYWYYSNDMADPGFDDSDFALFNTTGSPLDNQVADRWEGT